MLIFLAGKTCCLHKGANVTSRWDGSAVSVPSKLRQIFVTNPPILIEKHKKMHFFCIFFQKYLVISIFCSTFAPAFERKAI